MDTEARLATWMQLAEPTRTAIVAALTAAADGQLRELDSFYPASFGQQPTVEVLAVRSDDAGVRHVHFLAHALNYNFAQSGSDWADHYVLAGDAVLGERDTVGAIRMAMAAHTGIREYDWDDYRPKELVDTTRAKLIEELG